MTPEDEERLAEIRASLTINGLWVRLTYDDCFFLLAKLDESERARVEAERIRDEGWAASEAFARQADIHSHEASIAKAAREAVPLCRDLRHVCGGCGFMWPERSAYDELVLRAATAEARVAELEAELAEMNELAEAWIPGR